MDSIGVQTSDLKSDLIPCAVILIPRSREKDLCHFAQGEAGEESRHSSSQGRTEIPRRPAKRDAPG
jgi:hypothetical protein